MATDLEYLLALLLLHAEGRPNRGGARTWRDGAFASAAVSRPFEYKDTGTIWLINNRVQLDKIMALKLERLPSPPSRFHR